MPTLLAFNSAEAAARRQRVLSEACGYYAETIPLASVGSSALASTQILYGMGVGLLAGDVVTSLTVGLQTIGVSVTLAKVAVYSKAGSLLASSADQSSVMNGTTGMKTITLTLQSNGQPLVIPTDDLYYAAFLAVGVGTQPTLLQAKGAVNAFGAIGSGVPMQASQAAQTDLPSPTATLVGAATARSFWIGVS